MLNIGFIGAGAVAQAHLTNLAAMRGVRIAAVCDVQRERREAAARSFGAQPYADHRKMLRAEGLDGCYVCLIPSAHGRIELDLVRAGLPFFIEKPVHLELNAARRVLDAVRAADLLTCVGYHWRYTRASAAVKKLVSGRRLTMVEGWWSDTMPQVGWWRRRARSGGQLVEQATHVVDMARFLGGEIHTVFSAGTTGSMTDVEGYDIHDASVTTLMYDDGAIGQVTSGCVGGARKVHITAMGRDWWATTDASTADIVDGRRQRHIDSCEDWLRQIGNGDRAFIAALRKGDPSRILSDYARAPRRWPSRSVPIARWPPAGR